MTTPNSPQEGNHLLNTLSETATQRLAPYLETVSLSQRQLLYQPRELMEYAYFPKQAMVSLLTVMEDGSTVETGLIGKEGVLGISIVLGESISSSQAIVQIPGEAFRIRAESLKAEFQLGSELQRLLLKYLYARYAQVSQSSACNTLHTLEERFARWLLSVQDSVELDELPLTQESIAEMLGVRRSSVTVAAGALQKAGIIRYARGRISILDRNALEASACECYGLVRQTFDLLLNKSAP
jgi:CRP-like cAMP-binding protein